MSDPFYVINASPLIVFQRIGQFRLLRDLQTPWHIPPAVRREVFEADPIPDWLIEQPLAQPLASRIVSARLGAGESEAIALALEINAARLVLDDLAARRLAQSLNIPIIGSAGLLLEAKQKQLIPAVRPLLTAMQDADFRIADRILAAILRAASES